MHLKFLLAVGTLSLALGSVAEAQNPTAFWISVIDNGVYRVAYEDLTPAASPGQVDSSLLALTHLGEPVPIWLEDGGDGTFGPGDSFDFVGSHLTGDTSFYSEHSRHNTYRLTLDGSPGRRVTKSSSGQRTDTDIETATLIKRNHLESDEVMVRFSQRPTDPDTEVWFWQRMSFLDPAPFELPLDTSGLAPGTSRLRVQMRGWSSHRLAVEAEQRQHQAQVAINGIQVATGDWDAQDFITIEGEVPPATLAGSEQPGAQAMLTVAVPSRHVDPPASASAPDAEVPTPAEPEPMIDLSLLNWIELDYPHSGVLSEAQTRLTVSGAGLRKARLSAPSAATLVVYDDRGQRWAAAEGESADALTLEAIVNEGERVLFAVRDDAFLQPDGVAVDRPSNWRATSHRIDYLMIAHPSLLEGTERLAAFHRSRGLEVAVIDVQDVYDEFNHGIVHPRAIRDLIANAYENWAPPKPRFVLLVGDASWDVDRDERDDSDYADWSYQAREGTREGFLKNGSTPYATGPDDRGLIPTGSYKSAQGHAASDNYFVALDAEDFKPYLAIGRFPVVEPAELDAIVDKTVRYVEESGVGPWRRKLLWISNEAEYIQRTTDKLASEQQKQGFTAGKVYPLKSEKSNEQHQERLLDAFAEGQLVVHFHGHGGRYIWRTGPTDYKKNRDLFNLDHLDMLEPSSRLPVVLSMTCFSAPFDHPLADSIGEKFLRLPDRGAIVVLAASWRNSPATVFSRSLLEELTKPQSIGEAILTAKQSVPRRDMVETYNLLGDPAVRVAAPQSRLELEVVADADELRLRAQLPGVDSGFTGTALIEWLDAEGVVLATDQLEVSGGSVETSRTAAPEFRSVSVYMWDVERGLDGLGYYDWTPGVAPPRTDAAEAVAGPASH